MLCFGLVLSYHVKQDQTNTQKTNNFTRIHIAIRKGICQAQLIFTIRISDSLYFWTLCSRLAIPPPFYWINNVWVNYIYEFVFLPLRLALRCRRLVFSTDCWSISSLSSQQVSECSSTHAQSVEDIAFKSQRSCGGLTAYFTVSYWTDSAKSGNRQN